MYKVLTAHSGKGMEYAIEKLLDAYPHGDWVLLKVTQAYPVRDHDEGKPIYTSYFYNSEYTSASVPLRYGGTNCSNE